MTTRLLLSWLAPLLLVSGGTVLGGQTPPPGQPPATVHVDAVALDASGRQVTTLRPDALRVTIDGEPRAVVSLRYVFRGTGAAAAARAQAGAGDGGTLVAAEPSRLVLVAVDETSFERRQQEAVVSAVRRVGDALAPDDRVGLVSLPSTGELTVDVDRQPFRQAIASIRARPADAASSRTAADRLPSEDAFRTTEAAETGELGETLGGRSDIPERRPVTDVGSSSAGQSAAGRPALAALVEMLDRLRDEPGPKTVVYVWGGRWGPGPGSPTRPYDPVAAIERVITSAAAARVTIHVVEVTRSNRKQAEAALERLARETGGTLALADDEGLSPGRLTALMAGSYLVEVEERAGDRLGASRVLEVMTTTPGVTVVAARRWTARDDPAPRAVTVEPDTTMREETGPAREGADPGVARDVELEAVVGRASQYLEAYFRDFSSVVAEEEYTQSIATFGAVEFRPGQAVPSADRRTVRLRSDLLLIRTSGADWTPFRDVFEVDGRPVRDRDDRLRKLFLEKPGTALSEGERITQESSRYNVGSAERTVNTPTMALFFLLPEHLKRLRLDRRGTETVEGVNVWRIDFEEIDGPTLIRVARTGEDLPSKGSLWIDPATGRIVKTFIRCDGPGFRDDLTVTYRRSEALGLWAPAEMKELYTTRRGDYRISGTARYSNYRRFEVTVDEHIAEPVEEPKEP